MATARLVNRSLARSIAADLSVYLRADINIEFIEARECLCSEFLDSRDLPTCIAALGVDGSGRCAFAEISSSVLGPIIDLVLGGDGAESVDDGGELTEVERDVIFPVFRVIVNQLNDSWTGISSARFGLQDIHVNPRMCRQANRREPVVVTTMEIRIGKSRGLLNVALPAAVVKRASLRLEEGATADESGPTATEVGIRRRLARELFIDVACEFRQATLPLREVRDFRVGETIDLGIPFDSDAILTFNGVAHFRVRISGAGARAVARLEAPISPSNC